MAYVDYAGASLPSRAQLDSLHQRLLAFPVANPHSRHAISANTAAFVAAARLRVYSHLHTTPDEYDLIFTYNTTESIHLVARSFKFPARKNQGDVKIARSVPECKDPTYMYLLDSHTSVVGARELVREKVDTVCCIDELPADWSDIPVTDEIRGLFVMTGMSNFCGRKYDVNAVDEFQRRGFSVFYDVASLVSSSALHLDKIQPHFVGFSFYKMFGYPTGLAALLVHKSARSLLVKKGFGGGSVLAYLPQEMFHIDKDDLARRFEEGTPNFYAMAALREGFEEMDRCGGIEKIGAHCDEITRSARSMLRGLKHANGIPVTVLYEHEENPDPVTKGPIIAFNVLNADGSYVGFSEVEKMADLFGINLRTGCVCNAGACQKYLGLTNEDMRSNFESGKRCGDLNDLKNGKPLGMVRLSFGKYNTHDDLALIESMLTCCFVRGAKSTVLPASPTLNSTFRASVAHIFVYPVKSCRRIAVDSWPLSASGFLFDRSFSVSSADITLTQKRAPRLCNIVPSIDSDRTTLTLSDDSSSVIVPLRQKLTNGELQSNLVCTANVPSYIVDNKHVDEWLAETLDLPICSLSRAAGSDEGPSHNFSNDSPYLLVSASSAAFLSSIVDLPLNELIERFRPNVVVTGLPPFIEDQADEVVIDGIEFEVVSKCTRCEMICIDQTTGQKDPAALLALRSARKGEAMTFGIYLREKNLAKMERSIGIGSTVELKKIEK